MAIAVLNSQELWSPTQDLYKVKPALQMAATLTGIGGYKIKMEGKEMGRGYMLTLPRYIVYIYETVKK